MLPQRYPLPSYHMVCPLIIIIILQSVTGLLMFGSFDIQGGEGMVFTPDPKFIFYVPPLRFFFYQPPCWGYFFFAHVAPPNFFPVFLSAGIAKHLDQDFFFSALLGQDIFFLPSFNRKFL